MSVCMYNIYGPDSDVYKKRGEYRLKQIILSLFVSMSSSQPLLDVPKHSHHHQLLSSCVNYEGGCLACTSVAPAQTPEVCDKCTTLAPVIR